MATLERLAELTAKPQRLRFFHCSCGNFQGDPAEVPIGVVVVQSYAVPQRTFDAYRDGEADALRSLAEYVAQHHDCVWVGWRCLREDFGPLHWSARYRRLTGCEFPMPPHCLDLKEILKQLYGNEFAPDPKLEGAAQQNHVTTLGLLTAAEAKAAFDRGDFAWLRRNTARRAAIIGDLFRIVARGEFVSACGGEAGAVAPEQVVMSAGDGIVDAPDSGFISAQRLADVLGVHPTRRAAFLKTLERNRLKLGDSAWQEVTDPRPHAPRYLYSADAPAIRALAGFYRVAKPI
jgi:hypothetical protein